MKELVEKIQKTQKNAAIEPTLFPVNVRHGWEGKKRRAIEDLPELKARYKSEVKNRILGIFVTGEKAQEFSDICTKEYNLYAVGAEELYDRIVKAVKKTIKYGKVFTSEQVLYANFEVEKIAKEIGLFQSIPLLSMDAKLAKAVNNEDALRSILKSLVRKAYGYDLDILYMVHRITDQALEDLSASPLIPVVITGAKDDVLGNLSGNLGVFRRGSYLINTGETTREDAFENLGNDINKKTIGQILGTIKKNLKK